MWYLEIVVGRFQQLLYGFQVGFNEEGDAVVQTTEDLVHGLHAHEDVLAAVPVDIPDDSQGQVLAQPVQLFRRRQREVQQLIHLVFDQSLARIHRVDGVDVPFVSRTARRTATESGRHDVSMNQADFVAIFRSTCSIFSKRRGHLD